MAKRSSSRSGRAGSGRSGRPGASSTRRRAGAKRARAAAPARRKAATRGRSAAPGVKPRTKPRAAAADARKPARATAVTDALSLPAPNGRPAGTGIGLTHHHMSYGTHDLEAMRRFFVETLGFTNVLHIPEHGYMTVFVTPTSSLGFMPPAGNAPEQWQPPGEPSLYFFVADVDAACAALVRKGVALDQPPTDMPWGHRLALLRDPEGRRVCLAQNLQRSQGAS